MPLDLPVPEDARAAARPQRQVLLLLHDLTEARRLETTRREFVSNVSHELRSPVTAIRASTEALEAGALDEPDHARDFLRRIHQETERMDQLVGDLLHLSRLQAGQLGLALAPTSPARLVEAVVDRFKPIAESRGIALTAHVPREGLPDVLADTFQMERVLANLVDNALRFTPRSGKVDVSVERYGETVVFAVRDTGDGIPPEHLPHIFERFYKVDRARRDPGTGLGLAIAKHTVRAHGGEIWAESALGKGSTFRFSLPVSDMPRPSQPPLLNP